MINVFVKEVSLKVKKKKKVLEYCIICKYILRYFYLT